MPETEQGEETTERRAQDASATDQSAEQAQTPGADASAVGNAGVEARAKRSDVLPPAPDASLAAQGPPTPASGAAVNDALTAVPFQAATLVSTIAQYVRNASGAAANLARDVWLNAFINVLNGAQMYEVLGIVRLPAPGAGRVASWMDSVVRAHIANGAAPATAYTSIVAGASAADLAGILAPDKDHLLASVFVMVPSDPLTVFSALQTGLSAEAAASATFVEKMLERSTHAQIWRAIKGTPAPVLATLAAALNAAANGWGWLPPLDASAFSPADRAVLNALHPAANADGQAKITAANAVVGVETPNVPFATAFDALKAGGVAPTAGALRTFLQTGTPADRVAVLTDNAKADWIFAILTGHPFLELSVDFGTRGLFMAVPKVFDRISNTNMTWSERLSIMSDRRYVSTLTASFATYNAGLAAWIAGLPPKAELPVSAEADLRAIGLAAGDATISAAIVAKFTDTNYDGSEGQAAVPSPASAHDSPLTQLDGLLAQPAPPAAEVLSMLGALNSGPNRTTVIGDAARMTRIQNVLDDERFYQAIVLLRLSLTAALTQIRQKGQSAPRVQSLVSNATALDRNLALRDNDNIAMVQTVLPDAPLQLFFGGNLDAATLAHNAWRTWVLAVTPIATLLPLLGADPARATNAARELDAANAWGFLGRVPSGPALSGAEKDALTNLLATTGVPQVAATLRSKVNSVTEPAAPLPGVPPAPVVAGPEGGGDGGPGGDAPPEAPVDAAPEAPAPEVEAAPEPTPRQLFEDEVQSPIASETRVAQLSGELSQGDRDAVAATHKARIVALLSPAALVRFVGSLTLTLSQKFAWLRAKPGIPNGEIQALVALASVPERVAIFHSRDDIGLVVGTNALGPFQTIPGIQSELATLVSKPLFWWWVGLRCTSLDLLKIFATCGNIPVAFTHLTAMGYPTPLASLPRGTGLSAEARGYLDTIMAALTSELALARDIFAIRFDAALSGTWAAAAIDDIRQLYVECQHLPIAHVANNPKLQVFDRGSGGGGSYVEGAGQVNMNVDDPTSDATMFQGPGQTPVTERYFDHTVRHEIGHSVDAMLGSRTSLVFGQAGWKEYGTNQLEQWIQLFDGWNVGGGPAPSEPEKQQIRDLILQILHSGGGAIEGPGGSIQEIAPDDHPWKRFRQLKIVDKLEAHGGKMTYRDRLSDGGKVFSINYYYRRFMECSAVAGASAPRDYALFAPAEWFADMYAEYYRNFNGTDDGTLGGACPGWVKSWFLANVHTVGGRSPQQLAGRALPPGERAHH